MQEMDIAITTFSISYFVLSNVYDYAQRDRICCGRSYAKRNIANPRAKSQILLVNLTSGY